MLHMSVRSRYRLLLLLAAALAISVFLPGSRWFSTSAASAVQWSYAYIPTLRDGTFRSRDTRKKEKNAIITPQVPQAILEKGFFTWGDPDQMPKKKPVRKPAREHSHPVPDPFSLLSQHPPPNRRLLRAPKANRPPHRHYRDPTPLLVGFTRNWPQLLQCVVSYIAAGWPPEDIYVVENTGVMHANKDGNLTLQNPFYLNHTQLDMLGVNIIITPTHLTFSQLQNFYLWTALQKSWPHYFWTHQDVLVLSHEKPPTSPSSKHPSPPPSLYRNAVAVLRYLSTPHAPKWAHHFFAYDHLTLVNRDAVLAVGGWDTHIPYYSSDCDMYVRAMWAGYWQGQSDIGMVLDVGSVLVDVGALLRIKGVRGRLAGGNGTGGEEDGEYVETWERLVELGLKMEEEKYAKGNAGRNRWQVRQRGGQGEPFYRDADGFEVGVQRMIDAGRGVFAEKWGHRGCDIARMGIRGEDAWLLERDWDEETEGSGIQGGGW